MSLLSKQVSICARDSALSRAQVEEVLLELAQIDPTLSYKTVWVKTEGDKDLLTSLLHKEKTNFFTKEVDEQILSGDCDVGIHSAKDLPDPLPRGLKVAAYTKGVDSEDVLVFRKGETLDFLPSFAKIGTSSLRRKENVLALRKDIEFVDIRGTIQVRLSLLDTGVIDACVMAKAALIRLKLDRDTMLVPGPTAAMQGRIALVVRQEDLWIQELLSPLDWPL